MSELATAEMLTGAQGVHDEVTGILLRQLEFELCFPTEMCVYVSSKHICYAK